ncbi:hypothetical protein SAMN02745194_02281 [Roseomonas rosea]|uniref:C1q domain-containing protein n=1 Tax=Muricoccus roseus TaxID=198092 RepID=A0A1M6I9W6_9PROT|nr:hypothetical protein [Roseomonas rosea]SHJ31227.1 hypothetical protein SAMN02745194_02281 [Roseomonas rosea]
MGTPVLGGDRVLVTTTTTGTSAYVLGAAAADTFLTPAAEGIPSGSRVMYTVQDSLDAPTLFEKGEGIFTAGSPATLTRAQIKGGSNGTSAVNWSAGPKYIFLSLHADKVAIRDTDGRIPHTQDAPGRISQLRRDTGFSVPNDTLADMAWDVRGPDSLGVIGAGSGPFGQFTVQEAGVYAVEATLTFAGNATGQRRLVIVVNGVEWGADRKPAAGTDVVELGVSKLLALAASDIVKARAYQNSGGGLIAGGNTLSTFSIAKIGG